MCVACSLTHQCQPASIFALHHSSCMLPANKLRSAINWKAGRGVEGVREHGTHHTVVARLYLIIKLHVVDIHGLGLVCSSLQ